MGSGLADRDYNGRIFRDRGSVMRGCRAWLLPILLLTGLFAHAAAKNEVIRITVLSSETKSIGAADDGVPKNCDGVNYDAYCHSSRTAELVNTLLVQVGSEKPFRIQCTTDSKWSRCEPLQRGATFDARKEKHGLTIYFVDEAGKVRKQLYRDVDGSPQEATPNSGGSKSAVVAEEKSNDGVQCSFTSTPGGAEISLDGQYVGSTPSALHVSPGKHLVVVSMPGFAEWKRDLSVSSGADLTVNAILQKTQ